MSQPKPLPNSVASYFSNAVYVVSDDAAVLTRAMEDGAAVIQLRDKTGDGAAIRAKAHVIQAHPKRGECFFILNDDPRLALEVGADGVHIGQDTDSAEVRRLVGGDFVVGKTTHCLEQARAAVEAGVDYISAGPVFPTPTKPGRPAVGTAYVSEVAREIPLPFVAIGGIDETNVDAVIAAGARMIGVVRAAHLTPLFLKKLTQL